MIMSSSTRILLLGATGYIGGSILTELTRNNQNKKYILSALVRKPEQASKLEEAGIKPLLFENLDDYDAIYNAAKENDIVIGAADARHAGSAKACINGLAERLHSTGRVTNYIQTSGTSMVGDWPVTGERIDNSIHSDIEESVFELEKSYTEPYSGVRDVDQIVVALGEKLGVRTYIIPPPLIFGLGTGMFATGYAQIHMYVDLAFSQMQAAMLGTGSGIWNRIHILDLVNLYQLLVDAVIHENQDLPSGRKGYYFAENGYQTWRSIAEEIGRVGKSNKIFETDEVQTVDLQTPADMFYGGNLRSAESVLASNSRTKADLARRILSWAPTHGEDEFFEEIRNVFLKMAKEKKNLK